MITKTVPEKIAHESEIRAAIEGYWSLKPLNSDNYFYENFKRSWNNFLYDFDKHSALDSRTAYMTLMTAALDDRDELYERCNKKLQDIESFVEVFMNHFEKYISNITDQNPQFLLMALDAWKSEYERYNYNLLTEITRKAMVFVDTKRVKVEKPWGNLDRYIRGSLKLLEQRIKKLASYYAMYWGMDKAITCVIDKGRLMKCDKFITDYLTEDELTNEKLKDKPIRSLLTRGHLVDPATKLRFLSLANNEKYTQREAYGRIVDELREIGFDPTEFLPDEPKMLGDRARRFRDKRRKELLVLSEN
ncbi:hypothetical protein NC796_25110 [Aliifodinibius sp. S!AR15-10]|uniref:hypothetical protein n=1 Tax=Aliifodinibius sp. S!AR15-10 TaxID=2950437 RepID=UPI0028655601|nr:hypothetical protein [Aliifodinibius sp. S!AR15-10]MDR8394450.1 hypothetical protein [Aliifodinibius sp. S!AR15-10]